MLIWPDLETSERAGPTQWKLAWHLKTFESARPLHKVPSYLICDRSSVHMKTCNSLFLYLCRALYNSDLATAQGNS